MRRKVTPRGLHNQFDYYRKRTPDHYTELWYVEENGDSAQVWTMPILIDTRWPEVSEFLKEMES